MRVAISTNYREKKGIAADAEILTALLQSDGHSVIPVQFDDNAAKFEANLLIFLEVINPCFVRFAPYRLLFVNPEWFQPAIIYALKWIDVVCCKTYDAVRLMKPIAKQVVYTGFAAEDRYDATVPRRAAFLHAPGKSQAKNTRAVIEAWRRFGLPYPLTVVAEHFGGSLPGVTFHRSVAKAQLVRMQNEHQFHIMASEYEGFGHALHESIACGAIVITGNYPPLNEYTGCPEILRVPSCERGVQGLATTHKVSPVSIMSAADQCWQLDRETMATFSKKAREEYLKGRAEFERRFLNLIAQVAELDSREPLKLADAVPA